MQILSDVSLRRRLVVTLAECDELESFVEMIKQSFDVTLCQNADECLEVMRDRLFSVSAVIIDIDMAGADDYAFLRTASSERGLDTMPVLVATLHSVSDADAKCLEMGAVEIIRPPFHPLIVANRVENAIRLVRSTTFAEIERMLCELPSMVFLKDVDGRYVFSTQYHQYQQKDNPNWTIQGKTDLEIRDDTENAIAAMEADQEIIRTGKGTSYVIDFIDENGCKKSMQLIKQPVFDDDGNVAGIIALGNDVTENEMLKRELQTRALTDDLTGMGNHRAFEEYIEEACAGSDFPIAVISADCDNLKKVNDTYGHIAGDRYIVIAAGILKAAMPEGSRLFRTGGDEFIVLVPGLEKQEALKIVSAMQARESSFKMIDPGIGVSFGVAVAECGDQLNETLIEADRRMYADKAARKRGRS